MGTSFRGQFVVRRFIERRFIDPPKPVLSKFIFVAFIAIFNLLLEFNLKKVLSIFTCFSVNFFFLLLFGAFGKLHCQKLLPCSFML